MASCAVVRGWYTARVRALTTDVRQTELRPYVLAFESIHQILANKLTAIVGRVEERHRVEVPR
jgi:hypothetical protein